MSKLGKAHTGTPETPTRNIDEILKEQLSPQSLARARKRADAILERMRLDELRKERHITQRTIAAIMGIDQGEVSRIEKRSELKLGTLRSYVSALGGHIEVRAVFPDRNIELTVAGD